MARSRSNVTIEAAIAEAEARYRSANPKSAAQYEAALAALPGGNTRTVLFYPPFPLTIVRGEGCTVEDADGHRYIDFLGEYTAGLYGHSHPVIRAALTAALQDGIVLGGHTAIEAQLAAALCARFPSLDRVRFTNSGTEANLMAVSAARAFTRRAKVMVMEGGYHGGVLYFADATVPTNAPYPYVLCRYNDAEQARSLIRQHGRDLACVLVEPMLGSAGCVPATREFLAVLRDETAACGSVLIFDEVMTSRLGPAGLQGRLGISADLTTLGKYLGGGLSFGAFGGRADVMDQFDPRRAGALPHAGTFNNNVLSMTAGLAGLREVYTAETAVAFNAAGDELRRRLNALAEAEGVPACFTGIGSMLGLHFTTRPVTCYGDAVRPPAALKTLLHLEFLASGLYSPRRGMYVLSLPMGGNEHQALRDGFAEFFATRRNLLSEMAS